MTPETQPTFDILPFVFYVLAAMGILAVMYGLSHILGQRHSDRETNEPYESGIKTTGSARVRFDAQFYLVAMLFVIFDLEVAFIFGWAIVAKEVGWGGYWGLIAFLIILIVGFIYEWRMGALDWIKNPAKKRIAERRRKQHEQSTA